MVNETVIQFMMEFERKFQSLLRYPDRRDRTRHFYTEFFRIKHHMAKEQKKYSDWDLCCWLKPGLTIDNLEQIDEFMRKEFAGFTDIGLFSLPGADGRSIEESLQYMGFMPKESHAPFLDFQLKGPIETNVSIPAFRSEDEHLKWAILTGWRKINNGNIGGATGARETYRVQVKPYLPEENMEEAFINTTAVYYSEKCPGDSNSKAVAFLSQRQST